MTEPLVCRRCDRPVVLEADRYEGFEQMHYVCFHYEFEHDPYDVDEECKAGGCPSALVNPRPQRRPPNREQVGGAAELPVRVLGVPRRVGAVKVRADTRRRSADDLKEIRRVLSSPLILFTAHRPCDTRQVSGDGNGSASGGVFLFRGSPIEMSELTIEFDADRNVVSTTGGNMRSGLEMWPMWIRVAIDHEALAARARRDLLDTWDGADGEARGELLTAETRAGLVSMSAIAFALESMALSSASRANLPHGIGKKASAARRIAEVLKQCCVIPDPQFRTLRQSIVQIFDARNEAVHPPAGASLPYSHPAIVDMVPRPVHVFRSENASAAVTTALSVTHFVTRAPKPRHGRKFREGVAMWADFLLSLQLHRESLLPPTD